MSAETTDTRTTAPPAPRTSGSTADTAPPTVAPQTRMITDLAHGGHAVPSGTPEARRLSDQQRGISLLADVMPVAAPATTPFDYLFGDLADSFPHAHLPLDDPAATTAALAVLGTAMAEAEPPPAEANSTIPAVYTYWGQFVDHDLTANTDANLGQSDVTRPDLAPIAPGDVVADMGNLRNPALNLDSVYGDGPAIGTAGLSSPELYHGIKLRVGTVAGTHKDGTPVPGERIPPTADPLRDLPRHPDGTALVADHRNDENLVVAQLHTAFLKFHNAAVEWVVATEGGYHTSAHLFDRARQLVRWHYQWLTVHDYLETVCAPGVTEQVLFADQPMLRTRGGRAWMPLEFSTAAFRFGHSMVRAGYDFNRNFGTGGGLIDPLAPFDLLFAFTGKASPRFRGDTDVLPFNWVIEWDRMVRKGSSNPDQFARKIDTHVVPPLHEMVNEGTDPQLTAGVSRILKSLPVRNLLRGYLLSMPTGQAVASALGVTPLSPDELRAGASPDVVAALTDGDFLERTPLWFYVLKESEVREFGNHLGPVGSRIVAETIIGQIRMDPTSYLHVDGWSPADGLRGPGGRLVVTISDFLATAGVM